MKIFRGVDDMNSFEAKDREVREYRKWYEALTAAEQERILLDYFRNVPTDCKFIVARCALSMIDTDGSIEDHGLM